MLIIEEIQFIDTHSLGLRWNNGVMHFYNVSRLPACIADLDYFRPWGNEESRSEAIYLRATALSSDTNIRNIRAYNLRFYERAPKVSSFNLVEHLEQLVEEIEQLNTKGLLVIPFVVPVETNTQASSDIDNSESSCTFY